MAAKLPGEKAFQGLSPAFMLRMLLVYALIPLILFLCGWDLGWWQAWVFSGLIVAAGFGARLGAERRHPGLLAERERTSWQAPDPVVHIFRILSRPQGRRPAGETVRAGAGCHRGKERCHIISLAIHGIFF